jgi:hypothetical protein
MHEQNCINDLYATGSVNGAEKSPPINGGLSRTVEGNFPYQNISALKAAWKRTIGSDPP